MPRFPVDARRELVVKAPLMKKTNSLKNPNGRKNLNFERIMRGLEEATEYARGEADTRNYRVHGIGNRGANVSAT